MSARVRHRRISEQRIAKLAEAMDARGLTYTIKLGTDGEVYLTNSQAGDLTPVQGEEPNEWDERFGFA